MNLLVLMLILPASIFVQPVKGLLPEFNDPIHGQLIVSRLKPPFLTLKTNPEKVYYVPSQEQLIQIRRAVYNPTNDLEIDGNGGRILLASAPIFGDFIPNEMSQEEFEAGMEILELYTKHVGKMINNMFRGVKNNLSDPPLLPFGNIDERTYAKATIVDVSKLLEWVEGEGLILEQHFKFPHNKIIHELLECGDNTSTLISDKDFQFSDETGGKLNYYKMSCKTIDTNIIVFYAISRNAFTLKLDETECDTDNYNSLCDCRLNGRIREQHHRTRFLQSLRRSPETTSARSVTARKVRMTVAQENELITYFISKLVHRIKVDYQYIDSIDKIETKNSNEFEDRSPIQAVSATPNGLHDDPNNSKKLKIMEFKGGLHIAHQIVIRGTPAENLATLNVSLNSGDGFVALHININFSTETVVLNSLINRQWQEDDEIGKKLNKSEAFEIKVSCESAGFKIELNGQHIAFYRHRIMPSTIQSVSVGGDIHHVTVMLYDTIF